MKLSCAPAAADTSRAGSAIRQTAFLLLIRMPLSVRGRREAFRLCAPVRSLSAGRFGRARTVVTCLIQLWIVVGRFGRAQGREPRRDLWGRPMNSLWRAQGREPISSQRAPTGHVRLHARRAVSMRSLLAKNLSSRSLCVQRRDGDAHPGCCRHRFFILRGAVSLLNLSER